MEREHKNLRHELKYFINYFEYKILSNRLRLALKCDGNSDINNEYHIRSLYFDDVYNSCLFEKQSGIKKRDKLRIRIYNMQDSIIKLEKKSKYGQLTCKETAILKREHAEQIIKGDVDFLLNSDNSLLRFLYLKTKNDVLKPVVIVDYVREAYTCNPGNVRITFDKYLKTGLNATDLFNKNISSVCALDEPVMIMEIKFDSFLPDYIKGLLQIYGRQKSSISKYDICRKYWKSNNWEDN